MLVEDAVAAFGQWGPESFKIGLESFLGAIRGFACTEISAIRFRHVWPRLSLNHVSVRSVHGHCDLRFGVCARTQSARLPRW